MKDMVQGCERPVSLDGDWAAGVVDYRPIFAAATGLKHYFIEQEEFESDAMEALRVDADYMKSWTYS